MLKRTAGFTLIELLITMVILAILTTIAIPGFGRLMETNKLASGTNLLVSSIKFARSEAVKRGSPVTFSPGGDLNDGWCVHDGDATGNCTNDQIRGFEPLDGINFNGTAELVFDRRGFLVPQSAESYEIAPDNCASGEDTFRTVRISPVGRTDIDDGGTCP